MHSSLLPFVAVAPIPAHLLLTVIPLVVDSWNPTFQHDIEIFLHLYMKETLVIKKFIDHLLHMFKKTKSKKIKACMIHDPNIYKASITQFCLPTLEAMKKQEIRMFAETTNNINKFCNNVYMIICIVYRT